MNKTLVFIFVIIILAVGGFFALKYFNIPVAPIITNKTPIQLVQKISEKTVSSKTENKKDNYLINYSYPQFSGIQNQDAEIKINNDLKNYILNLVSADEKSAVANCNFSNLPGGAPDWQCEYDLGSSSFDSVEGKILSVKMEYYQFTGGAHGGSTIEFLNYNLATGEKINWQNVFKKDSNYLQAISDYSKTDLTKQLLSGQNQASDKDWIKTGTDPSNKDNYSTNVGFLNENGGLAIVFAQYQVAPHSTGMPEVNIPYAQLKNVLDPAGSLGDFTK